jgi:uncharacterized protein YutE (UPF0331/DUF86 family)
MTVRPEVILSRLAHFGFMLDQLERLRTRQPSPDDEAIQLLALERALQVSAEALFDIGHHVLAGRGHVVPGKYREIVPALVAKGILPPSLAPRLEGMAGLRNILVHDYARIDEAILRRVVDEHLSDLREAHAALSALPELAMGA